MAHTINGDSRSLYDDWHTNLGVDTEADAPWHRLLLPHVERLVPGADVLEIGCGRGGYALRIWQTGPRHLVSADFSPVAVEKANAFLASHGAQAVDTCVEDIGQMSFPDRSFDVVISCETIEHVPDPRRATRELARVLRPSGSLLLSTPNYLSLHGLYRAYLRIVGRPYTEQGQPINNFMMAPRTASWLRLAGLHVEYRLGDGFYLPIPRVDGPLRVPLRSRLKRGLRPFLLHSAFVARKQ
jgi:SAM-dependent methyltransferase